MSSDVTRQTIFDVGTADFPTRVLERSRELPVVVDFWAEWCGPCRQLTPALETAARARPGKVELAKVDVDANQQLAASFRVQGIPAVKAFRDGRVASEFTGALPPVEVERFFDALVPSESDELVAEGDEESLRRALELDPRHLEAAPALARLLLRRGEAEQALELARSVAGNFLADGLAVRAELTLAGEQGLQPAFEAWDAGDYERALELLQEAFQQANPDQRDALRRVMVAIFTELGADDPLAREHRRRLSAALS